MLGQAASLAPPTDAMALEPPATAASVGEVGIVEGASTSDIVTTPQPAAAASTAATTTGDAAGEPTAGGAPACPSPSASAEPCPMRVDPCPKPVDGDATCGGQGGGGKCKLVTQEDAEQEQAQAQEHAEQPQVAEEGWRAEEGRQAVQKVVSLGGRRVVCEVDGLKLHLSKTSRTGYKGVHDESSAFTARATKPPKQHLGSFATALDAAICYARHMLSQVGARV